MKVLFTKCQLANLADCSVCNQRIWVWAKKREIVFKRCISSFEQDSPWLELKLIRTEPATKACCVCLSYSYLYCSLLLLFIWACIFQCLHIPKKLTQWGTPIRIGKSCTCIIITAHYHSNCLNVKCVFQNQKALSKCAHQSIKFF